MPGTVKLEATIHIHLHDGQDRVLHRLDQIVTLINQLGVRIMADLTALTAEVARNTSVDESAIVLLTGLAAQIEALKTDPVALQGLADTLRGSSDALAAAVAANTPAG